MNGQASNYRPEIDGLRALAVLAVILYHAEFAVFGVDVLAGGYVGVDVFFVISGYLICRIILNEVDQGTFTLLGFYKRRAKRILPLLFVVLVVTFPLADAYLVPERYSEYAESILAALGFVSNFFFYFSQVEYGAESSLLKPLLHTWSLSVEEQFYLFFPLLAVFMRKWFSRGIIPVFLVIAGISFCFSLIYGRINPALNFFLPISRIWELLAGAWLAAMELNPRLYARVPRSDVFACLGLSMLIGSMVVFNESTRHPGVVTLIPVLGSVILISCASQEGLVTRMLSSWLCVQLGLISYSLYLWHFPVLAFARLTIIDFNWVEKVYCLIIVLGLSVLSYAFIETPFRQRWTGLSRWAAFSGFMALMPLGLAVTAYSWVLLTEGRPERLTEVYSTEARQRELNAVREFVNVNSEDVEERTKPVIYIVGDSYARNWSVALKRHIDQTKFDVVSLSYLGCTVEVLPDRVNVPSTMAGYEQYCEPFEKWMNSKATVTRAVAVFLVSHRPFEYTANRFRFDVLRWLGKGKQNFDVFVFGNYFQLDSSKHSSCLNLMFQTGSDAEICVKNSVYPQQHIAFSELPYYPADLEFTYVDLIDLHCRYAVPSCEFEHEGVPFMADWNHLTVTFLDKLLGDIKANSASKLEMLGLMEYLKPGG